ncbi:MAG: glycosyltransferase, partial [Rhodospirillales bacterium]|nr:glycosyltransferase [Rhodospirillales bacterium]
MAIVTPEIAESFRLLCDPAWYRARNPDIAATGRDPLRHFIDFGLNEGRDPNPFFDGAWYRAQYMGADMGAAGEQHPLLHYLREGAARGFNPHPEFDAEWYVARHPDAAFNPLLYHLRVGRHRGLPTAPGFEPADFLASTGSPLLPPAGVAVDVVIPVYRGLAETRRCLESVLADPDRPPGAVIVIDDATPEKPLAAWLGGMARAGRIRLLRNARNQGFVASVERGMEAAGRNDVALLNADTEVPSGWLARLAGHAYAEARIASVSPFSNNATICGYPSLAGGPPAFGLSTGELDAACREANAGRSVAVPTTVGFCMYIRRAALDAAGGFDIAAFGRGYGEEVDFCRRAAAAGWSHRLACDVFVFHQGAVSFGANNPLAARAQDILAARWPDYPKLVARHAARDPADPARFALTAALFRRAGAPVEVLIDHGLGGGIGRHLEERVTRAGAARNFVRLSPHPRGARLDFPALPGHPPAILPARLDAAMALLGALGVSEASLHQAMGHDLDIAALLFRLGVPFEVTAHDYFLLCPQVNLLPSRDARHCGEPGQAVCNACIAARPSHGARDITTWRQRHAALLLGARLVLCPSQDTLDRFARLAPGARLALAPHDPEPAAAVRAPRPRPGEKLRVLLLGVLAPQKGAAALREVLALADPARFEFRLIGALERPLPPDLASRIAVTGRYKEADLPRLIAAARPHLAWFPATWPETWSYTLSAALHAGLPVVASAIGAFPERLAGRALSFLVDPAASAEAWLAAFEACRAALARPPRVPAPAPLARPALAHPTLAHPTLAPGARPRAVAILPERYADGTPSPCAHIRLMQPLDHPANAAGIAAFLLPDGADPAAAGADAVLTHRNAVPTEAAAEALIDRCRGRGISLIYDLDDDLLALPAEHPDAARLGPMAGAARRLLTAADRVTVSTPALARRIARLRPDARVLANALDERLWGDAAPPPRRDGNVRLLYMGSLTHGGDLALILPALERLREGFGAMVGFDLIGVTETALPDWIGRLSPPPWAGSYPGFVAWLRGEPAWDIGLAPLRRDRFNDTKSPIKAMEYAALG